MNPCGRTVQQLRSCYTADVKFFADSDVTTQVMWYFTPQSREWLGLEHSFGTSVWDEDWMPEPPIGEVRGSEVYSKGYPPYPVPGAGLCGSSEQWLNGASINDSVPAYQPGTLIPVCCSVPQKDVATGGLAIGGTAAGFRVGVPCNCLGSMTPYQLTVTFTGFTGVDTGINGTWVVTQTSACGYLLTVSARYTISAGWTFPGCVPFLTIDRSGSPGSAQCNFEGGTWNGVGTHVLPLDFNHLSGTPTNSVLGIH